MKSIVALLVLISTVAFANEDLKTDALIVDEFFSAQLVFVTQKVPPKAFKCEVMKCWLAGGFWQHKADNYREFYSNGLEAGIEIYNSLKIQEKVLSQNANETVTSKLLQVGDVHDVISLLGCLKTVTNDQVKSVSCTFFSDLGVKVSN